MEKRCTDCQQVKPLAEFDASGRNGKMSYCKACRRERRRSAYVAHPKQRVPVDHGQRFGKLTVLQEAAARNGSRRADCTCDCGTSVTVNVQSLLTGETMSCGCHHGAQVADRNKSAAHRALITTHGMAAHSLYATWRGMIDRCENPRHHAYGNYGARGIKVHPAWHDVAVYIAWVEANLGPRHEGMTIDRINNDGNYEPGNIRWATRSEQRRNRRDADSAQLPAMGG